MVSKIVQTEVNFLRPFSSGMSTDEVGNTLKYLPLTITVVRVPSSLLCVASKNSARLRYITDTYVHPNFLMFQAKLLAEFADVNFEYFTRQKHLLD